MLCKDKRNSFIQSDRPFTQRHVSLKTPDEGAIIKVFSRRVSRHFCKCLHYCRLSIMFVSILGLTINWGCFAANSHINIVISFFYNVTFVCSFSSLYRLIGNDVIKQGALSGGVSARSSGTIFMMDFDPILRLNTGPQHPLNP